MRENITPPLQDIWNNDLCAGCGACAAKCPEGILICTFDPVKGVYQAGLSSRGDSRCTGCALCSQVCPVGSELSMESIRLATPETVTDWLVGTYKQVYTGHATDDRLRYECSSGGITTALLLYLMQTQRVEGVILPAPLPGNKLRHGMTLVKDPQDIIMLSGSIYCPVDYTPAWHYILNEPGRLAIVGLPCQIRALKSFLALNAIDEGKVFAIGLFCGGMSRHTALNYLAKRKKIHPDHISTIRYRSGGWPGRRMLATIESSPHAHSIHTSELFNIEAGFLQRILYNFCFSGTFFPRCCQICRDQTAEQADISLGDAWLTRITAVDRLGTNIIISRTGRAQQLLAEMATQGLIKLEESGTKDVLDSQGTCLVGRKLGLWGSHRHKHACAPEALHACESFFPQYIPTPGTLYERRFFNWLTGNVSPHKAFLCYISYHVLKGILSRLSGVAKRLILFRR